ncbi:uncharacterized protein RHOBADRAFT_51652 [Rhodotorula graminis WP1]|uniref:Uncharacterized protein n=1 Tax=Rhodotorula graminis (strain WP1) TaxID=578459 RepID=A0A194SB90_RHOGW|nr:uncharacterized protein RHOBADRAFT_51652 [Rhodotorula graminis WP1]KPV77849.1 hypothetical protein RHOBADRAFT_51652 [Rhodotorula graminis WP1]
MRVQLSVIDTGAQDLGLCRGFVFALPRALGPAGDALVDAVRQAVEGVVREWILLRGVPVWQAESRTWAIDTSTHARPTFSFTTATVDKPYHQAINLSQPLEPLSSSSTSGEMHPFVAAHFRHAETPTTMQQHAKKKHPLLSVHIVRFVDAVSLGISAPHGLFDGTGLAHVLAGITAGLRDDVEWVAPPVHESNPLSEARRALMSTESTALAGDEQERPPVLLGWTPFSVLALVALLMQALWDKWRHGATLRYAFISRDAVDALVDEVKGEVKVETSGKEWVSTGDVLTAWVLKNFHGDDASATGSVLCSPVFNIRSLLATSSTDLAEPLASHTGNAVVPYSFSPQPIRLSHLAATSVGALALVHRRTLAGCKTLPWLRDTLLAGDRVTQGGKMPMLPLRDFPWVVDRARGTTRWIVSNHMSSFAALRIPRAATFVDGEGDADDDWDGRAGDLPLLAYYRSVAAPLDLNSTFALQLSDDGLFVVASARRARWDALMRAIDDLDRRAKS